MYRLSTIFQESHSPEVLKKSLEVSKNSPAKKEDPLGSIPFEDKEQKLLTMEQGCSYMSLRDALLQAARTICEENG